ncbi:MAG: hypothetical protein JXR32_02585, partial [Anaerolineaceae bacterium]|nr:hypothetical protein [Anaerolineaceae bacterium]
MDIIIFIENALDNSWVVVGLSVLVVIAGYFLSRLLAGWIVRAIQRASRIRMLASRFKDVDTGSILQRIRQVIHLILFLLSVWGSWMTLNSHPDVSARIGLIWQSLIRFFQLPVVIYAFDVLLIGLATLLLIRVIQWGRLAFDKITKRIEAERGKRLKDLHFQHVRLMSAYQVTRTLQIAVRYTRYLLNLLLFILYLVCIFSLFPQTRGVVTSILNSVFQVIGDGWNDFMDYLPNLFNLVIIIIITRYGIKLVRFIFQEIEKGTITFSGFHREWATPTYQLVRILVIILALVVAFPY